MSNKKCIYFYNKCKFILVCHKNNLKDLVNKYNKLCIVYGIKIFQ